MGTHFWLFQLSTRPVSSWLVEVVRLEHGLGCGRLLCQVKTVLFMNQYLHQWSHLSTEKVHCRMCLSVCLPYSTLWIEAIERGRLIEKTPWMLPTRYSTFNMFKLRRLGVGLIDFDPINWHKLGLQVSIQSPPVPILLSRRCLSLSPDPYLQ